MDIEKKHSMIDNFQLIKTLGAGYHAKVKLGFNAQTNQYAAIKVFKSQHSIASNLKTLKNEIDIMNKLNHPNLVNLFGFKETIDYVKKDGKVNKVMAILMEYAGAGELFEYVANTGRFSEEVSRSYFKQLVSGLEYIHQQGIAHRDLKPENLLFDLQFNLKICDFGFSTLLMGKDGSGFLHTVLGTESYMAPEIHAKKPYKGNEVDLFAAAIILFIMYAGTPPFNKADTKDAYYKLLTTGRYDVFWNAHSKHKPNKDFFSPEFKDLIARMLAEDPKNRLTIPEIWQHPWIQGKTLSQQELFNEFSARKEKVDAELEKARMQKQLAKQQQANNMMYKGPKGFRSGEGEIGEFEGLSEKYNLEAQRQMKEYNTKSAQYNDFFTALNVDYLLKLLLKESKDEQPEQNKDKEEQFYYKVSNLSEKNYKLTCESVSAAQQSQVQFTIQFFKADNDMILVDFQKKSGTSLHYQNVVKTIKDLILNAQTN